MKRACTQKQIDERKIEIIKATNKMFDELDYQDISMKTISEHISIARSSLYCYYSTKEEIMLDVLKENFLSFLNELIEAVSKKDNLIENITNIYLNNTRLLKIISVHLTDIETHCSLESLINFKKDFVKPFADLHKSFVFSFSSTSEGEIQTIENALIMLTHSLYPMIYPTQNQLEAMKTVGMKINDDSFSFCYNYLKLLLQNLK